MDHPLTHWLMTTSQKARIAAITAAQAYDP
jgi:hypothetical protein